MRYIQLMSFLLEHIDDKPEMNIKIIPAKGGGINYYFNLFSNDYRIENGDVNIFYRLV